MRSTLLLSLLAVSAVGSTQDWDPFGPVEKRGRMPASRSYAEAIRATAMMVNDPNAQRLAQARGLDILNVTWEDTGRYKGSSVGPNISDMTIQVGTQTQRGFEVTAMPVIRFPNFRDVTGDLSPYDLTLMVGNHRGGRLHRVSLAEVLQNPTDFLSNPRSWPGRGQTLWSERDEKVLVSAQACFLPIPQSGKATFNPVLFNYQSVKGDPAVLTILATREGTSMTIIDNQRDAFQTGSVWGQRLFHNTKGQRASLTGERMSDFVRGGGTGSGREEAGLNMVMLIQVPLKQRRPSRDVVMAAPGALGGGGGMEMAKNRGSDVENAVIGHGEIEGPFTEIDGVRIERDERFPVRVTVQFYKATSNGVVRSQDLDEIKSSLDRVYRRTENVGSLVTQGETGRATEYWGMKVQPASWWREFWIRHERNTGDDPETARRKLIRLLGRDYQERPVCDLYLRDTLRRR